MITCKKSNLFADLPVTLRRVVYTSISAVVYFAQLASVVVLGFLFFCLGKRTEKKESIYHRYIYSLYLFDMNHLPGVSFSIRNRSNEQFERGCVIVCNHQSMLDSVCMILLNPKILLVTNDHVWKNRVIHAVLRFANYYPISRGLENGLSFFREQLQAGYSIVIFPEGERSEDCSILRFHRGAFYVAEQLQCDILPVYIHGVGHAMPKSMPLLNKGEILVDIGPRIPYGDESYGTNYAERSKQIRHLYQKYDLQVCKERENAAYFAEAIGELYKRRSRSLSRQIKMLLRKNVNFSYYVDAEIKETTIFVLHDVYGVIGLLMALVHPEKQVFTTDDGGHLKALQQKCNYFPKNLRVEGVAELLAKTNPEVKVFLFAQTAREEQRYASFSYTTIGENVEH